MRRECKFLIQYNNFYLIKCQSSSFPMIFLRWSYSKADTNLLFERISVRVEFTLYVAKLDCIVAIFCTLYKLGNTSMMTSAGCSESKSHQSNQEPGSVRITWGMVVPNSSRLNCKEKAVLDLCSLIYINKNNVPNWAESDATFLPRAPRSNFAAPKHKKCRKLSKTLDVVTFLSILFCATSWKSNHQFHPH